ncbi:MAG: response regulator [Anaerolineae bacterium]|nr:response regulator [Anaerolineae bacterium]
MAGPNKILIVEDDANTAEMLSTYFAAQGYAVRTTSWGLDALRLCRESTPDLVIQDIHLPDIDGYQVVRTLRASTRTSRIPIIFLTQRSARDQRIAGLSLGAVDYVSKPCDLYELRLRVQNALQRARFTSLVNPVTGLSGREVIEAHLRERLDVADLAIVLVSVGGSEAFGETYGFVSSDDALRAVATILDHVTEQVGSDDDVVGHVDRPDFVVVTRAEAASRIRAEATRRLSRALSLFYPARDLASETALPEMHIRIGVATAAGRGFSSPAAALASAAEAQQVLVLPQRVRVVA